MNESTSHIRINQTRFKSNFEELSKIGASTVGDGVNRPALGTEDLKARRWFRDLVEKAGLDFRTDSAGNQFGILECGPPGAPSLLFGSHLDTVPNGGKYDGALGVLAAIETLNTIKEADLSLKYNLEAVNFTDEEGTHFGMFGSRAICGLLKNDESYKPLTSREKFESCLSDAGLTSQGIFTAMRDKATIAGYLELHIEQGPVLENSRNHIGVVTAIAGIRWFKLKFIGRPDHAGTTPMADRLDPLQAVNAFALKARELVLSEFKECVMNIGNMKFSPGAFNVVPANIEVSLEIRAPEISVFDRLESVLLESANEISDKYMLRIEIEKLESIIPASTDKDIVSAISAAASSLELKHMKILSGAGHDAQSLAHICPVGMIFVPSINGRSHSPQEYTAWEDCINGANVLLHSVLGLAC